METGPDRHFERSRIIQQKYRTTPSQNLPVGYFEKAVLQLMQ